MKKKFLLSIFIAVFVFASLGSVLAKDVAYIAKDTSHLDSSIVTLLEQGNYSYDVIYQTALDSTNFSKYSIILVGEGIYSNYSKIPVNKKNSVILNTYYLDEWKWTSRGVSTIASNRPVEVVVYDKESSIIEGISEYFVPYYTDEVMISYKISYIPKSLDASGLNTIVADDLSFLSRLGIYNPRNGAVVATIDKGAMLRDNQISEARGVFFGFPETQLWTEEVKSMFYNSIEWAMIGEDRDKDGFYSDMDCDDNNFNINPNMTEIAYDGIDQNCDGYDLADIDNDGYCKLGYAINNRTLQCPKETGNIGTDCDDEDTTYNINSTNLTKNCVNDAPIIETIYRISVHETESAELYVDAYDPEGDEIEYSINDSRFVQDEDNENHFTWETGYEDEGDYDFFVTVSDPELSSQKKFDVKVWNKNKGPELIMDIPPQEWDEDTNHSLNLTQYFYDLDGDPLIYLFHNTSYDLNIGFKKMENGVAYFDSAKDWYGEDWIIFKATDGINVQETNKIILRVLPVNDAPRLIKNIGTITTNEDAVYNIDLSQYFYDVDSALEYSFDNTTHITLTLDGDTLEIIPQENWYGEEDAEITVSDGEFELTEDFTIKVLSVNDAPVVQAIEDKFVLAGGVVEISASATDVEGNNFTFLINDSRFVQADENYFEWQTGERDFGVYNFKLGAYDGNSYGYANVKVNVLQKIYINELVWGNEGWVELYNPENTSFNLTNCILTNGEKDLMLYGNLGNNGFAVFGWNALESQGYIELFCNEILIDRVEYEEFNVENSLGRKTDGFNNQSGESFVLFDYPTKGVSNSADVTKPEVELISPENNSLYTETRDVLFEFKAKDNMAETLTCSIVANLKSLETGEFWNNTLGSFYIDYLKDGIYVWNIECSDGTNKNSALESWMINISAPDAPTLNYIGNKVVSENNQLKFFVYSSDQDGDTIKLSALDLPEGANFTDNGNGNGMFVWTPNYNQSGTYNVKFFAKDSTGLEDSETITILVGNTKEPPKFSDADVCSVKNNSIEISIKDPDEGDEFEIGDIINGTIKIKNRLDDSRDFDVKVYLYDTKEEQVIEDFKDSIKIKHGKSGEIEFSIKIPDDVDENDGFAIYAYAESDEDECNSNYVEIEINRKKHEVIIGEIKIDKEIVSPGDELEVKVKAENLGREDEEIFILVEIPSLSISEKSEAIDIEKYGDDDSETKTFTILIPDNAPEGIYGVKATVTFDNGNEQNSEVSQFTVTKGVGTQQTINQVQQNSLISLSSSPQGKPLTMGDLYSTTSTTPTGSALNLGGSSTPSTTNTVTGSPTVLRSRSSLTSLRSKLVREKETLSLGISEKTQTEKTPEVKVEFNDAQKKLSGLGNTNSWVLLAVVLGLLIIIIFILIFILM